MVRQRGQGGVRLGGLWRLTICYCVRNTFPACPSVDAINEWRWTVAERRMGEAADSMGMQRLEAAAVPLTQRGLTGKEGR